MISDTLFDAVQEIDRYVNDPVFRDAYQGELRTRILLVRNAMEDLRDELETVPDEDSPKDEWL